MVNPRKTALIILIASIITMSVLVPVLSDALPHVGLDDEYEKGNYVDYEVEFVWTLSRDPSIDYAVRVDVLPEREWDYQVSPSHFVLDEGNPHEIVRVSFSIPRAPEADSIDAEVQFYFRELGTDDVHQMNKTVTVNVKGVTPAPESNTIIFGIPNPLPAPLNTPYGAFVINLATWFFIGWVFYFLVSPIIHGFTKKTKTNVDEVIIRMIRKPLLVIIFLYGLLESLMKLNLRLGIRTTIYQIYLLTVVIIGILVTYRILLAVLKEIMNERGGPESTFGRVLKPVLEKVVGVILLVASLIMIFHVFGVEVTALLAGAGIIGLVIAFAAQDTLANFFSGMHLLLDKPIRIGDIIQLETGEYCRIEDIGMRTTKLYNIRDHEGIILPNNNLANQAIVNIVEPDATIRARIEVGVAYGSDVAKVKSILYEVASNHPDVMEDDMHSTGVRFRKFGDSSLEFSLRVWVNQVIKQWGVMSDIHEDIDRRFREEGIEIPFPQRTVWMHHMNEDKD